ncbi:MAG TPA: hypothetical protein VGD81_09870 [Opitutaceae bacterium]
MAKQAEDPRTFISQVSLVGRGGGTVKSLRGFDKSRHSVPDAVNAATSSFLARLCAAELAEEGEQFFQRTRAALAYKRKDIALDVTSPAAVLTTKDFAFELAYALEERDPASYLVTRTLHSLRSGELLTVPEFDGLFAGLFSGIVFGLAKGVRVEAVIDAVEGLDEDGADDQEGGADDEPRLRVDYPSDCRQCTLTIAGVEAEVICDGATLEMRFARNGSPKELIAAFAEVRRAFALTKNKALAGLLG